MKNIIDELKCDVNGSWEELQRLEKIIEILRARCPWDMEQTHQSLRQCMIEEAYECCDAIDRKDYVNLKEELGDVLLQVIFHSQLAMEGELFSLEDVIRAENHKMIRRHPHIFSKENIKTVDKTLEKWENIKRKELAMTKLSLELKSIPKALPALLKSYKLQKKASGIGFDWQNVNDAMEKVDEELSELKSAIADGDRENMIEELGDLIFAVVNISRFINANPEEALEKTCAKFIDRFEIMESIASEKNINIDELNLDEMDELWDMAKQQIKLRKTL